MLACESELKEERNKKHDFFYKKNFYTPPHTVLAIINAFRILIFLPTPWIPMLTSWVVHERLHSNDQH